MTRPDRSRNGASATPIPARPGDRRPLATITVEMALSARLRGQIRRVTPLTSPAATHWYIDDHVSLHARAEICIDTRTHRVRGAAVGVDPATVDLTGTAVLALAQSGTHGRYDHPWSGEANNSPSQSIADTQTGAFA